MFNAITNKAKTMAHTSGMGGNDGGRYQLAKHGAFNVQPFGPCMTLQQAQGYQADMALANMPVLVVRVGAL